jgi:hypothetical protein
MRVKTELACAVMGADLFTGRLIFIVPAAPGANCSAYHLVIPPVPGTRGAKIGHLAPGTNLNCLVFLQIRLECAEHAGVHVVGADHHAELDNRPL